MSRPYEDQGPERENQSREKWKRRGGISTKLKINYRGDKKNENPTAVPETKISFQKAGNVDPVGETKS